MSESQLTIITPSDLLDNPVHRPSVEVVVGEDLEGETVLYLILLDSLPGQLLRLGDREKDSCSK